MLAAMQAANDAEVRGDADGALRIMSANLIGSDGRIFWNPDRMGRLLQIVRFGPILPRWAISRWILEQALIHLDPVLRPAHEEAMRIAIDLRGGLSALAGADPIDAQVKVMDHDWVHRQLLLYDYGGLARFLEAGATPDLIAGGDSIAEWCDAPLRAMRLEARAPSVLRWTDIATGDELVVPNLGAAVLESPGEHVLARVVPTETGPMFDGVPLGVAEATARTVAEEPAEWVRALRLVAGTEDYFSDLVHGNLLLTDVPDRIALLALLDFLPGGARDALNQDTFAGAIVAMARQVAVAPSSSPVDVWPCLAAHLLAPEALPYLADHIGAGDESWLDRLAHELPEPAGTVCRHLLERTSDAA